VLVPLRGRSTLGSARRASSGPALLALGLALRRARRVGTNGRDHRVGDHDARPGSRVIQNRNVGLNVTE